MQSLKWKQKEKQTLSSEAMRPLKRIAFEFPALIRLRKLGVHKILMTWFVIFKSFQINNTREHSIKDVKSRTLQVVHLNFVFGSKIAAALEL